MNPDRNTEGMTLDGLMKVGLLFSAAIPVVVIAILGIFMFQRLQGRSSDATTFLLIVVACAIVVFIGILTASYVVQRKIKDRLLALVNVCRDYSSGNRNARVPVHGDDEFALLANSLNTVLESQANGATPSAGGDAAALQAQIEKLLQEVSAVGDGDLRVQAEVTPDTLGVLADSFNYMIEELAKVVGRVQSTAVQVTNATRRILDGSADLAQASETQVAQISQTTEAVEALAVFIQNVARNAQLSAEAAQEALQNASIGQQAVRQSIEGMINIRENVQETSKKIKRLGERSNEIGEIVRIIADIADQTNLLALNAAIQSAMAGEHGRGFAVVADEIRLLAERSTESTRHIETLVKSIQGDTYEAVVAMEESTQEVVKGSQLADEVGRALNSIFAAVERQAQMIEGIARAANEQTSVSEAVAVAMGQISEITRQTNAATQEAAASVSYLADLAEQLRASVSTFRLPEQNYEMAGAFPGMVPQGEFSGGNNNQYLPFAGQSAESEWAQGLAGNVPPLAGPGNSGSLRAGASPVPTLDVVPAHNGQFFNANGPQDVGQQGFGRQQPFAGQSAFAQQPSAPGFGEQGWHSQPGFAEQYPFETQQAFAGGYQFESQPGFGQFGPGENQALWEQPSGNQPGFGSQGQGQAPFSSQIPHSRAQSFNSGPLQQQQTPGQSQGIRQRQQWGGQQYQGQPAFEQDQSPFPGHGPGQFNQ